MSLETTYKILSATTQSEAVGVLARGAASGVLEVQSRCYRTLVYRRDIASHEAVLARWPGDQKLIADAIDQGDGGPRLNSSTRADSPAADSQPTDLPSEGNGKEVSDRSGQTRSLDCPFLKSVMQWLDGPDCDEKTLHKTIEIVSLFQMRDALPRLISLATSHASHLVREASVEVVLSMAQIWGRQARRNYAGLRPSPDMERKRIAVTTMLLNTLVQFQSHRQEGLLDSFLVLVTWNDPCLQSTLGQDTPCRTLILRRLRNSRRQNVMELLAGYFRRRTIPDCVLSLLLQRKDATYRESLLQSISATPTAATLANLKEYGLPDCLRGGVAMLRDLGIDRDAAVAHAYSTAMQQDPETIAVLLEIVDRHRDRIANAKAESKAKGGSGKVADEVIDSVAISLSRCECPNMDFWLDAFASGIMDGNIFSELEHEDSHSDRAAKICLRLIELSQNDFPAFAKAGTRLLSELTIQKAISAFPKLSEDKKMRLGRALMQVDSSTLEVVKDGLRHAVMQRRLEAIEFTQTLGLVDLMIEPLAVIARTDHQTARLVAVRALGTSQGEASSELLKELADSHQGSLRDAAVVSMKERGMSV
ncbi:hypothetical protein [Neorhodopirellula lusitana]|uniref:hypothetical protein n=1 Tax=Neorhodopirellula lusitana TaxID=445327 RepID=UPI00384ED1A3